MESYNPYAPPVASVADINNQPADQAIDNLQIADVWKARFKAIARAGGPKLPHFKSLPMRERRKAQFFNILAYLLGPIYYIAKGMWKKALTYSVLSFAVVGLLSFILSALGYPKIANALHYGVGVFFALQANGDMYKKHVLQSNGWW